jgi:putative hydroxymethylpyrimidine transport system ATP-binding protein
LEYGISKGDVTMLEFQNVTFRYPEDKEPILENLSFQVKDGDFASIIGSSGCGKSTIFRLINGLEKPQQGQILVNGEPIEKQRRYTAFMPQKDLLFPWCTIEKNLTLPMELQKIPKEEQKKQCTAVLEQIGMTEYRNKYPRELSGGMKQRVAFARTLLAGGSLLLLDEPFSALDFLTRVEMQEWILEQWSYWNKTILFITHDVEEAIFLSNIIFTIQECPFSTMKAVNVPLQYPRNREDLRKSDITQLKETLIRQLRKKEML